VAIAGWLALAGPAVAQNAPYYRMVTPPQQTPLPWHAQPAPASRTPQPQASPPAPSLSQNYQALRQHRAQEQRQMQTNTRVLDTVRRLDR